MKLSRLAIRIPSAILIVLLAYSIGRADEAPRDPASDVAKQEIDRAVFRELLEKLGSRRLSVRRDAERDLLKLGPDVLGLLPAPELLPSIQVKQAARRLRVALEHQLARESIRASTVEKTGTLTLAQIADLFRKETGNEVTVPDKLSKQSCKIDWQQSSFWAAVSSLEQQKLATIFNPKSGRFEFAAQKNQPLADWQRDAFRAQLTSITTKPVGDQRLLRCELTLASEPRLRPLLLRYHSSDWKLTTSNNRTIANFNPTARYEIPLGQSGREAKLQLNFLGAFVGEQNSDEADSVAGDKGKPAKAETLNLQGRATLLTAAHEQPIRFSRLDVEGIVRRRAGVSVNLQSVKEHTQAGVRHLRVQARVSYDIGRNAFESHQTWIFHNRVYLETKDGKQIALNDGFETLFHADGSVGVVYRFKNVKLALADLQFVYVAPTLLINVPLDIKFSNVKL